MSYNTCWYVPGAMVNTRIGSIAKKIDKYTGETKTVKPTKQLLQQQL
jgi:hypothetical protein